MNEKLICFQCGEAFTFSEEERQLYDGQGFDCPPRRCSVCRGTQQALSAAIKPEKIMYSAVCDGCGKETQLPFKPKGDKPVYCRECFVLQRKNS